ncbi:MAG: CDP-diacylglycerol diphosphatase [Pseudomonadota bacterium]|nr:CDP-diacylglycerol diphosphatase [Pseudomonadota bacterium]
MTKRSGRFLLHKVTRFAATMGLILATIAGLPHSVPAANRSGLWIVVHDICLPAYQDIGVAFPCAEVSIANGLDRGFAVLRTPSSAAHVIVVPTTRISGIESPALLRKNAPNYWEAAWDARRFVEKGASRRLPRDKIGMAINPAASRSQDQLHIHVGCIAPAVADFLRRHQAEIHGAWSFLSPALLGHRFAAMKVETDSLARVDPFKLLARGLPSGKFSMRSQTLAVIGATFVDGRTGFYLLANDSGASPRDIVSAEALLDDKCAN